MNERYKELAEQAGFAQWTWQQRGSQEERLQKFTELIVRECGKSCTLQADEDDMFRKFGIKHFGVEE